MDAAHMHERAQTVFAEVLERVDDGDLEAPTPCTDWTVGDLIQHVIDGNRTTVERMGRTPTELPVGGRVAVHRAAAEQANAVFRDPGWRERAVELPFGTLPAPVFAGIRSGDLYAHAWDLATAIGANRDLDPELGDAIFAVTAPVLGPALRGAGRPFADEQPCAADRPIADRLAAFLGRRV
jgi:uncharacterized protein (TIGR03086 family)